MSKIPFRSPYKTTGSGQPPRSVYGENMPRTLLRRHDKYQARAGLLERRRRREVLTAIIVMAGDIAARRHTCNPCPGRGAARAKRSDALQTQDRGYLRP